MCGTRVEAFGGLGFWVLGEWVLQRVILKAIKGFNRVV